FFCQVPAPTMIFPLALHDALPISLGRQLLLEQRIILRVVHPDRDVGDVALVAGAGMGNVVDPDTMAHAVNIRMVGRTWSRAIRADRKSTRLNSSHVKISYAVFCLK